MLCRGNYNHYNQIMGYLGNINLLANDELYITVHELVVRKICF